MKKKELYRIIDNLKPDSCLKNRVSDAVESKDKIRTEKRPVLIPAVMMLLICVNLGAMAAFFGGDSLNSRWSDTETIPVESMGSRKNSGKIIMEQQIDDFFSEISVNEYDCFTVYDSDSINPYAESPWYFIVSGTDFGMNNIDTGGGYVYRRYVQTVPEEVTGYSGRVYTNHEYIVRYDGNGFERENAVYVVESSADFTKGDFFRGKSLETDFEAWDQEEKDKGEYSDFLFFLSEDDFECVRHFYLTDEWQSDSVSHYSNASNYWKGKDTSGSIVLPNLTGKKYTEAVQILEQINTGYRIIYPSGYSEEEGNESDLVVSAYSPSDLIINSDDTINVYVSFIN
ncbi:MAG: PASTA domain-containing protein [Porcipelethomonas sp.]